MDKQETDDLMSTLGSGEDSEKKPEENDSSDPEQEKKDELNQVNIDNATVDDLPEVDDSPDQDLTPKPEPEEPAPAEEDITPDALPTEETSKLPSDTSSQPQAQPSFYLVELYSSQGMFESALKVLDILQSLDADPGRIAEARSKIKQALGEPIEEPVEPAAEPEIPSDPAQEPPIPSEPEELPVEPDFVAADITDDVEPQTPKTDSIEDGEYENQRIDALKQRAAQQLTSEATSESADEIEKDDAFDDVAEQKRIAALMKRSGASDSELEQFSEEVAEEPDIPEAEDEAELQHIRALEKHAGITEDGKEEAESAAKEETPDSVELQPEPEIENGEELARIARLEERQESLPSDPIPAEKPIEKEPVENKWFKWVYVAGAVAIALLAVWLFWPTGDSSTQQKLPPQVEVPIVDQADAIIEEVAEVVPVVIDTIEAEETIVKEPEIVEVEVKKEIPEVEPPPAKRPPVVKSLPVRNLQVNARARAAFLNGDYWLAATDWGREKKRVSSHYTIILLFACQDKTIMNAYKQLDKPADFFLLPRYIGDQQCYTICWGDFKSRSDALAWYKEIPAWFRDNGANPMVRSFAQIKISSEPPPAVKKTATIIPILKPEPEPQKIELVKEPEVEPPVIIPVIEEPEEVPIDTIAVETEPESDELPNQITTVEEAFIDAMISIPMIESDSLPEISEPEPESESEPDQSDNDLLDSVIVLIADDRPDDWIEMDESTQALEPETEIAGDQFVEIAELESEIEPIPEPEPDYTPSDLLKLGRFTEAAGIWEIQKRDKPKNYTIKLLVACQTGSVNEAYRALNQAEDFFILPKSVKGDECFAICWGDFTSKRDAKKRLKEVPDWFSRSGGKPALTTLAKIYK